MNDKIIFNVGEETLVGNVIAKNNTQPQVLFLHGAGQATKERALPIAERLANNGAGVFAFDFSGHGESTGLLNQSSIKKRVAEAEAALKYLDHSQPISICAFSMGGHIALELLANHPEIQNLFLFYPGIYSDFARELSFNDQFSAAIRIENSWRNARVVDNLKTFKGNLLVVVGEQDSVIPRGVISMIDQAANHVSHKRIWTIPEAPHLLLPTIYDNPSLFDQIIDQMADYLR